jgi:NhaP-type Na+/H+ or K+/H+ antiporter
LALQLVCFVALAASRAANIWPCAALTNYLRLPDQRIPQRHQFMLWWAGLRGAMAFAIALKAAELLPGGEGASSVARTVSSCCCC